MADKSSKVTGNIKGKYYVDTSCIACGMCGEAAPKNFKLNDDGNASFVFKQPTNEDEASACADAKEACPAEAIGDDG